MSKMSKKSQYELEREANIARNQALLEQLELKQAVDNLGAPKAKSSAKSKAKPVQPVQRVKREREPEGPRRQSARLRKGMVDPNETPEERKQREKELEEQRIKDEEARLAAEERARQAKRPRHNDLKLATLAESNGPEDLSSLSSALEAVAQTSRPVRERDPDAFVFDDNKKDVASITDLKNRLQGMKVVSRAKVTENRVYCAAYHPEVTKDLIFFGDKHGQLGIWDAQAPQEEETDEDGEVIPPENREGGKYWRLQLHWPASPKSSISCIKFDPIDSHNLYTSSYDCTIRSLSFTSGISREIYATDERTLICSIDLTPTGNEMWISDGEGGVTHLDLRERKSKARRYELSEKKIGSISVNPTRPNYILTASNSQFIKIWDARKLQLMVADLSDEAPSTPPAEAEGDIRDSIEFERDTVTEFMATRQGKGCLRGEFQHGKSASSAYWDPRGRQIVSTSYDDTLRLWNLESPLFESSGPFPSLKPFSRINHSCQTGKWLTILRAQWNPNPEVYPHFTVGSMEHSLDIFSCKGDVIAKLHDLTKITAVQAVTASHPSIVERAVSGNASGRCVLWAPGDNS